MNEKCEVCTRDRRICMGGFDCVRLGYERVSAELALFRNSVEHVMEGSGTRYTSSEGWAMCRDDRLTDLLTAEEQLSAAPELLEALSLVVGVWDSAESANLSMSEETRGLRDQCRAAIAKATGGGT